MEAAAKAAAMAVVARAVVARVVAVRAVAARAAVQRAERTRVPAPRTHIRTCDVRGKLRLRGPRHEQVGERAELERFCLLERCSREEEITADLRVDVAVDLESQIDACLRSESIDPVVVRALASGDGGAGEARTC